MKATMDAREFARALEKAAKAVYRRAPVPALEQVRVDVEGDRCRLTATNLEQYLTAELPAEGGAFSLLLCNTAQVLKASKFFDGSLCLDYDQEHGALAMACGPRSSRIAVDTVETYPDFPEEAPQAVYHTNAQALSKRFERVKYAVGSPNISRKSLAGVHFTGNLLAAMDGYRVALNTDAAMDVRKPFILPMGAMALLPLFGGAEISIEVGEKWCMLRSPSLSLTTRMLDFDVIDFNSFIPANVKDAYDVNVKQFAGELKYLGALLPEKVNTPIRFSDGVLTVSTSNGEHQTAIGLSAPAGMEYGFDWRYMLDALGQFKGAETVTVKVSAPLSPIALTDGGADVALVMPVNLARYKNAA